MYLRFDSKVAQSLIKTLAKFTGKRQRQCLYFDKVAGFGYFLDQSLKIDKDCQKRDSDAGVFL